MTGFNRMQATSNPNVPSPNSSIGDKANPSSGLTVEATPRSDGILRRNLPAISNGSFVVDKSSEAALNWVAVNIIDELSTAEKRKVSESVARY